jgi:hypothetical protein
METAVALFIFRRPDPTARVFEAIREAKPAKLFIVADGPRIEVEGEDELVNETRRATENVDWPCEVTRIYAPGNLGLRERLLSGLDQVFELVDEAIILEDDCLPNQSFFSFCSQNLDKYRFQETVGIISGFNFAPRQDSTFDYFFSRSTFIWGWATWARTWKAFRASPQVESWTTGEITDIARSFASLIHKHEFLGLLKISSTLNTWDISLAVWVRQTGLLNIIPNRNFIENIGFGAEATHTKFEAFDVQAKTSELSSELRHCESIRLDEESERSMWRRKTFRWLTYPILHPLELAQKVFRYLKNH